MELFWSPGCTLCLALAPAIRSVERRWHRPEMIITLRGPVSLTEDAGFASPIVFDDRGLARTFDVEATPSAVAVYGQGKIVSAVIRDEPNIR